MLIRSYKSISEQSRNDKGAFTGPPFPLLLAPDTVLKVGHRFEQRPNARNAEDSAQLSARYYSMRVLHIRIKSAMVPDCYDSARHCGSSHQLFSTDASQRDGLLNQTVNARLYECNRNRNMRGVSYAS